MPAGMIALRLVVALAIAPSMWGSHHFHATAASVADSRAARTLPPDGWVTLPSEGGDFSTSADHYDNGVIRFDRSVSSVTGVDEGGLAYTTATVTLENLDIGERVRASKIVARVTCRHTEDAAEAAITFEGSEIENLTIDGQPINVELNLERFARLSTYRALQSALGEKNELRRSSVVTDLGGQISENLTRLPAHGVITVPGLGVLVIGSVEAKFGQRQLTMVRVILDNPRRERWSVTAQEDTPKRVLSVEAVEGNGTQTIP
jgi:hypothetical protein